MATFTNQHQPTTGSLLSRLMAKTSAGAADVLSFAFDDKDEASSLLCEYGRDDDDDSTASSTTFGNWWNWRGGNNHAVQTVEEEAEEVHALPVGKKTRNVDARKPQAESTCSRDYLNPTLRDMYVVDPHGRDARSFAGCFEFLMIYLLNWSRYQRKGGGVTGRLIKFAMQESLCRA